MFPALYVDASLADVMHVLSSPTHQILLVIRRAFSQPIHQPLYLVMSLYLPVIPPFNVSLGHHLLTIGPLTL